MLYNISGVQADEKQYNIERSTKKIEKRSRPFIRACGTTWHRQGHSEGGIIRLETPIELKFIDSSFSSLSSY